MKAEDYEKAINFNAYAHSAGFSVNVVGRQIRLDGEAGIGPYKFDTTDQAVLFINGFVSAKMGVKA